MKTVLITGGFGWLDIGDEAMPRTFIDQLRQQASDIDICMISPKAEESQRYHQERAVLCIKNFLLRPIRLPLIGKVLNKALSQTIKEKYILASLKWPYLKQFLPPNVQNLLDEFSDCSLLINVGGGNINSMIIEELLIKTFYWTLAGKMGKPIMVSGQNLGPFTDAKHLHRVLKALKYVSILTLRDRGISRRRLGQSYPPTLLLFDAGDDAYNLKALSRERAEFLLNKEFSSELFNKKYLIGFNLKASLAFFGANSETLVEMGKKCATLLDKVIESYDANIIMIPTDYSEGVDDREVHRLIVSQMSNNHMVFPIEKIYNDRELKAICALCDFIISSRYHCCIFAASSGIPFLGYANGSYQLTKLQGLCELLGMPELFVADNFIDIATNDFMERIDVIMNNLKEVTVRLEYNSRSIEENTKILPQIAANLLNEIPSESIVDLATKQLDDE